MIIYPRNATGLSMASSSLLAAFRSVARIQTDRAIPDASAAARKASFSAASHRISMYSPLTVSGACLGLPLLAIPTVYGQKNKKQADFSLDSSVFCPYIKYMDTSNTTPKTLIEAINYFSDYSNARKFMVGIRWPSGQVCCPRCGSVRVRYIQTRRQWECREQHAKRRFSLKTGTIMEDSPLPLEKWLAALWLEVNAKNSISSWEIHRALGVTQKSAWFMLHRIRLALKNKSFEKLEGVIEADETFVGGLAKNMHEHRRHKLMGTGGSDKAIVGALLKRHDGKRHSTVRVKVLPNVQRTTLHGLIQQNVKPGSTIYTDAYKTYQKMGPMYFHDFVDHADTYVRGAVHTNGLENFWALFKRCIKGTHVSIEPFHLEAYVDSEAFRFNNREMNDGGRFLKAAFGMNGRRLTYKKLIGASDDQAPGVVAL
jgi:transposase-like protein